MDKIRALPDDTKIFCGHEYTKANMRFAQVAEPQNKKIQEFSKIYAKTLARGSYTVPSVLKDEKEYNVFMRCHEKSVQELHNNKDPEQIMYNLRAWKNNGFYQYKPYLKTMA